MSNLELLRQRHSVRAFSPDPIAEECLKKIRAAITMVNTHEHGIKFQLITDDDDPFRGFDRSYGIFTNPRNYMAAVVDTSAPDILERAGYHAEKIAVKAVEIGLGTCFVGGTFDEKRVKAQLRAGEKVLFLLLMGYPAEKTKFLARMMVKFAHRKKMEAGQFFEPESGFEEALKKYPLLADGMEGVACAPSALNKRPTRIFVDDEGRLCARVDASNPKNLIDLGIAEFNFNFATDTRCEWGNGAPLDMSCRE